MSFDPNLPQAGTEIDAVQMRSQLNGLKALIDAIVTVTAAQIDSVTTLLPGESATVGLTVSGDTLHFSFGIPRGDEGVPGTQGIQGPPFANAVIDSVTSLLPTDPATVSVTFDGTNVHFSFGIPRGQTGAQGINGNDGGIGPQGVPGEVTLAQLTAAINTTSTNSNGVALLGLVVSDPPTQTEMQSLANKVDELITAMRR